MNIITPITITADMIKSGTSVAEPAAGETAWASGTAYAVGVLRIRDTTHRVYKCAVAHTSADSPLPEDDPDRWVDMAPTARHAPFDAYTSTAATASTSITYVLQPGYFNALALYGLSGGTYAITVKDAPAGATIWSRTGFLVEEPLGWYEYLFAAPKLITKLVFSDISIRPEAELTVTLTGASCSLGMLVCGDYTSLLGSGDWGGTQYGASAEPVTYSYIKTEDDGTVKIVRRHKATNMRAKVVLPQNEADQALAVLQNVLDVPVAYIATDAKGYAGLNVFGLGTSTVSYDSFGHATIDINVKGII